MSGHKPIVTLTMCDPGDWALDWASALTPEARDP